MSHEFWGITTFFNPGGYQTKLRNYRSFRAHSHRQGLPLVAAELAFGDEPFQLEDGTDAEIVVRRRSDSVMWHKERLLNLALEALPAECTQVAWLDADVLLDRDDWVQRSSEALEESAIIQPFRLAVRMHQGAVPSDYPKRHLHWRIRKGTGLGMYIPSFASQVAQDQTKDGTTGYAWCARRSLLDACGFYDRCILGGADRQLADAAAYSPEAQPDKHVQIESEPLRNHVQAWKIKFHEAVGQRVGYVDGMLHHLWHGDPKKRAYGNRHQILAEHDYDPESSIELDESGIFRFRDGSGGLQEAIEAYFQSRKEDG